MLRFAPLPREGHCPRCKPASSSASLALLRVAPCACSSESPLCMLPALWQQCNCALALLHQRS